MVEHPEYYIVWTETAENDLFEIINYIATDNVAAARKALRRIQEKAQQLASLPQRGRVVPELLEVGISMYREMLVKPWRIIYRIEEKTIHVLAVLDSRRDLETLLLERLLR